MNRLLYVTATLLTLAMLKCEVAKAQFVWGTSGLMHLPTAEMQDGGTFMMGWNWLSRHGLPQSGFYGWDRDDTMNYYFDVALFPWLEISYDLTLIRGKYLAESYGSDPSYFKKFSNQDRQFSAKLRLLKEGTWSKWVPQVVIGANDFLHSAETSSTQNSSIIGSWSDKLNGTWGRYYFAVTKHFYISKVGTLGAHLVGMYNGSMIFNYDGIGLGANLWLSGIETGNNVADEILHGVNMMAEYDSRTFNLGVQYRIPSFIHRKDGSEAFQLHLFSELLDFKHYSGGVQLQMHMR